MKKFRVTFRSSKEIVGSRLFLRIGYAENIVSKENKGLFSFHFFSFHFISFHFFSFHFISFHFFIFFFISNFDCFSLLAKLFAPLICYTIHPIWAVYKRPSSIKILDRCFQEQKDDRLYDLKSKIVMGTNETPPPKEKKTKYPWTKEKVLERPAPRVNNSVGSSVRGYTYPRTLEPT